MMMFEHPENQPILELTKEQSLKLLSNTRHGRLAFSGPERTEIFPVNFVLENTQLIIRTAPGTKYDAFEAGLPMSFETDGVLPEQAWSVVVYGTGQLMELPEETAQAARSGVAPWVPTYKDFWAVVNISKVSGRHFIFGRQPERDGTQAFRYHPNDSDAKPPVNPDTSRLNR